MTSKAFVDITLSFLPKGWVAVIMEPAEGRAWILDTNHRVLVEVTQDTLTQISAANIVCGHNLSELL